MCIEGVCECVLAQHGIAQTVDALQSNEFVANANFLFFCFCTVVIWTEAKKDIAIQLQFLSLSFSTSSRVCKEFSSNAHTSF